MLTLLVLRHAKSSWSDVDLSDHQRPLNQRGLQDAPQVAALMNRHGIVPERIISSSANRAATTADMVGELCVGFSGPIQKTKELYLAAPATYLSLLHQLEDGESPLLFVGHNPGLEELVTEATGVSTSLPTATLAWIEFPHEHWRDVQFDRTATLKNQWSPGDLED